MLRIALTPGEPAGIGPDITVQIAQQQQGYQLVAIADPHLLQERAAMLGLPLKCLPFETQQTVIETAPGEIYVAPVPLLAPVLPGQLDSRNAGYVLTTLEQAVDGCLNGTFAAMVTGPVQKSVINDAGIPFTGHTEFLAHRTHTPTVVMMLATEGLRVALVTTHLPLRDIADAITSPLITEITRITHRHLQQDLGISKPRILVSGLNPHAGEGGHLGREELDIIIPTLNALKTEGIETVGPLPADTLFTPKYLKDADAAIAMYHDQGLPVLKYKGFGNAVNVTLGLPIVRTSVDHGTALDLAGKGQADAGSLQVALDYAITVAKHRAEKPLGHDVQLEAPQTNTPPTTTERAPS